MVLESNVTNNCLVISFNSPKTSNSISADDWKELKEKIKDFEKSETKYLVLNMRVKYLILFYYQD